MSEKKEIPEIKLIQNAWNEVNQARNKVKESYKAWAERIGVDEIKIEGEEEYDDNNYFTAYYVTEVLGISCRLQSYHLDDGFEQAVEILKDTVPENSQRFITDKDKFEKLSKDKINEVKFECSESDVFEIVAEAYNRGIDLEELEQFLYYIIDLDENTAPDGWYKGY